MAKQTINIADKETLDAIKDKVFNGGKSIYFSGFNDEGFTKEFDDTPFGLVYPKIKDITEYVTPIVYRNKLYIFGLNDGLSYYVLEDESTNKFVEYKAPYNFISGAAVVYNDELHILGSTFNYYSSETVYPYCTHHYKFDGIKWKKVSSNKISYRILSGSTAVVYNNKIHILGVGDSDSYAYHYSWDGTSYTQENNTPFTRGMKPSVVSFNNTIYLFYYTSSKIYWYQWSGSSWTELSNVPPSLCNGRNRAFVHNDDLYVMGGSFLTLFKLSGTTWTVINHIDGSGYGPLPTGIPISFNGKIYNIDEYINGIHVVEDGKIYSLGRNPKGVNSYGGRTVEFKNNLYIFGLPTSSSENVGVSSVSRWDGKKWVNISTLPYLYQYTAFINCNDELHMFSKNKHYIYDGSTWTESVNLPFILTPNYYNEVLVYKNEIHAFYISANIYIREHYKFTGTEWVHVSKLPNNSSIIPFVVDDKLYLNIYPGSGYSYIFNDESCCWDSVKSDINTSDTYPKFLSDDLINLFISTNQSVYKLRHTVYNKKLELVHVYDDTRYNYQKSFPLLFNNDIYIESFDYLMFKVASKFYHVYNAKLPAGIHIMFEDDTVVEPLDNCSLEDDGSLLTTATGLVRFRIMGRDDLPQYTIY